MLTHPGFTRNSAVSFNARGHLLVYGGTFGFIRFTTPSGEPERSGFLPVPLNKPPAILSDGDVYAPSETGQGSRLFVWRQANRSWSAIDGPSVSGVPFIRSSTSVFTAPPDTLFAVHNALARTTDSGRHWEDVLSVLVISHGNTSRAEGRWFGVLWDSLFVSANHGRDWDAMAVPHQPNLPYGVAAEQDGFVFYLPSTEMYLWRKSDGNQTWSSHLLPWRSEALVTGMDSTLFLCRFGGTEIARSVDQGATWQTLPLRFGRIHELRACSRDTVIGLDTTRGLVVSLDRGDNWTELLLPGVFPRSMVMKNGRLYLGTEYHGILHAELHTLISPVVLSEPRDAETCLPLDAVLRWSAADPTGSFRVRCGTDSSFIGGWLVMDTLVSDETVTLSTLLPGSRFFWYVEAAGTAGTWRTSVRSFRTAGIPLSEIISPVHEAGCVAPNTRIDWLPFNCMNESQIQIARDSLFQSVESDINLPGPAHVLPLTLAYGVDYFARVRSTSAAGIGPWSPVVAFRTIDEIVGAPLQSTPPDGSMITTGPAGFIRWEKVDCVRNSEIVVARTPDFSTDTVAHEFTLDPYNYLRMSGGQWRNGTYYWKVRAWRDTVPGQWSPTWSFTLDIPVHVQATAPAEDFRIVRVSPMPAGALGAKVIVDCALPDVAAGELVVRDLLGRERLRVPVSTFTPGRQSLSVDVSALPAGQYLLLLHADSRHASTPLVIVR